MINSFDDLKNEKGLESDPQSILERKFLDPMRKYPTFEEQQKIPLDPEIVEFQQKMKELEKPIIEAMVKKQNHWRSLDQTKQERALYAICGYIMQPYQVTELKFTEAKDELIKNLKRDIADIESASLANFQERYKPR